MSSGDVEALAALFDRHGPRGLALARHLLGEAEAAERVVEDVFAGVWASRGGCLARGGRSPAAALFAQIHELARLRTVRARPDAEAVPVPC